MRNVISGILVVLGLGLARMAGAYPTLTGPTGYAALPTADTVGARAVQVAADYYNNDTGTGPLRLLLGIGCFAEVGAMYTPGTQSLDDALRIIHDPLIVDDILQEDIYGVNAKIALPFRIACTPLAIGVQYYEGDLRTTFLDQYFLRDDLDIGEIEVTQAYLVATRYFTPCDAIPVVRGTLGVNWTRIKQDVDDDWLTVFDLFDDEEEVVRVFLGVDISVLDRLLVAAEYQTRGSDLEANSLYSVVGRVQFTPLLSGQIGFSNAAGVLGTPETNFFLGVTGTFCLGGLG